MEQRQEKVSWVAWQPAHTMNLSRFTNHPRQTGMYLYRRVDVFYGFYVYREEAKKKRQQWQQKEKAVHIQFRYLRCAPLCVCVDCPFDIWHTLRLTSATACVRHARERGSMCVSHYMCCELDFRLCLEPKVNSFGLMDHKKPIFVFIYLLKFELFRSRWAIVGPRKNPRNLHQLRIYCHFISIACVVRLVWQASVRTRMSTTTRSQPHDMNKWNKNYTKKWTERKSVCSVFLMNTANWQTDLCEFYAKRAIIPQMRFKFLCGVDVAMRCSQRAHKFSRRSKICRKIK